MCKHEKIRVHKPKTGLFIQHMWGYGSTYTPQIPTYALTWASLYRIT